MLHLGSKMTSRRVTALVLALLLAAGGLAALAGQPESGQPEPQAGGKPPVTLPAPQVQPPPQNPPPAPAQGGAPYKISVETRLVVLHATVLDKDKHLVMDLSRWKPCYKHSSKSFSNL